MLVALLFDINKLDVNVHDMVSKFTDAIKIDVVVDSEGYLGL